MTLIIAEAGVNHNGSVARALEMIDVAKAAGADVVKFQTFKSEHVLQRHAPKAEYQKAAGPPAESQLEMARKLELDESSHKMLSAHCLARDIEFMSSPFDLSSLEFLTSALDVRRIKLASGEITNFPLLLKAARSGKRIILSTGMSTLGEVEQALGVIAFGYSTDATPPSDPRRFLDALQSPANQTTLQEKVTLLHCTTEYPTAARDVHLPALDTLRVAFGLEVGLSDHTEGIAVAAAAVARGAVVVEKHFTLSRELPGPDHRASLEPDQLKLLVDGIREVEAAMTGGLKVPTAGELKNLPMARRSLVATRPIRKGERFTEENLTTKRPGTGVSAMYYWSYIGSTATRDYEADELIVEARSDLRSR